MKKELGIGVFIALIAGGAIWVVPQVLIDEGYNAYICNNVTVGLCWKLSAINPSGFQTRCYYNKSNEKSYKNCLAGWKPYNGEIIGNETGGRMEREVNLSQNYKDVLARKGINVIEISPLFCVGDICRAEMKSGNAGAGDIAINRVNKTDYELEAEVREKIKEKLVSIAETQLKREERSESVEKVLDGGVVEIIWDGMGKA